jgi:hypothetical protein
VVNNRNSATHKHKNGYAAKANKTKMEYLNNFRISHNINVCVISNMTECDNLSSEDIMIIIIIVIMGYIIDYCRL